VGIHPHFTRSFFKGYIGIYATSALDWKRYQALTHLETSYTSDQLLNSISLCENLTSFVIRQGDIRAYSKTLEAFLNIRCLELHSVSIYSDYPVRPKWAALYEILKTATRLEELVLNDLRPVSADDTSLSHWTTAMPNLKSLSIFHSIEVKTFSDVGLQAIGDNLGKNLEKFVVFRCDITDTGLAEFIHKCPQLKTLQIPFTEIGDKALSAISEKLRDKIIDLDISVCAFVTDVGLLNLLQSLNHLKTLKIYGLHNAVGINEAKRNLFNLAKKKRVKIIYHDNPVTEELELYGNSHELYEWPTTKEPKPKSANFNPMDYDDEKIYICPFGCGAIVEEGLKEDHLLVCLKAPRNCPNKNSGCKYKAVGTLINSHLLVCQYYGLKCMICNEIMTRDQFQVHTETKHNETQNNYGISPLRFKCPLKIYSCRYAKGDCTHLKRCKSYVIVCPGCKKEMSIIEWEKHHYQHESENTLENSFANLEMKKEKRKGKDREERCIDKRVWTLPEGCTLEDFLETRLRKKPPPKHSYYYLPPQMLFVE